MPGGATGQRRCSPSSAWSTCPSCISPCSGGTRCTRGQQLPSSAGPRWTPACCGRYFPCFWGSRCSMLACYASGCAAKYSFGNAAPRGCGRQSHRDGRSFLVDGWIRAFRLAVFWANLGSARVEYLGGAPPVCKSPAALQTCARHGGDGSSMTPRRKRLFVVLGILPGVAASVSLAVVASRQNIMFYYDPSQIAAGKAPTNKRFRVGGMVVKGSVQRKSGDLEVRFVLTDFAHEVPVTYDKVL